MKDLIKPIKKKEVFEELKINAFHEDGGNYSRGGSYSRNEPVGDRTVNTYTKNDMTEIDGDLLF